MNYSNQRKAVSIFSQYLLAIIFSSFFLNGGAKADENIGELFIQAINSASEAEQSEICAKIFYDFTNTDKKTKFLDFVKKLHENYSPMEFHSAEISEMTMNDGTISRHLHIFAKKKDEDKWKDFQMKLSPEQPYYFLGIAFIAEVTEPVFLPNGDIEQKNTLDWLTKYIEKLNINNSLSGSILIAKGDNIIFEKYFGYADDKKEKPVNENTLFNMASGGKMFTALAIAKLVEEKLIRYEDKIEKYFPDFEDKEKLKKVTIHHLLNHSSGIAEYWTEETRDEVFQTTKTSDMLPLIYKVGFQFEPGSEFGYSNSNFILLGLIVEKVMNDTFYNYVKNNILLPSEMINTDYYFYGYDKAPLAMALIRNGNDWKENDHGIRSISSRGTSAGGCYSNLKNILKFSLALKSHKLISEESFKNMISDKTKGLKDATGYGYGFILNKYPGTTSYGHGGIAPGVNFDFEYFPESDITFIIFSNQDNGAFDDLRKNSIKLITGER